MFALLFSALFEVLLFVGVSVAVYQIFLSDHIRDWKSNRKQVSAAKESANKVALVKLVSDDPKDIEKFVSVNAQYLSDETVKKLVERIEMIKCDRIIYDDSLSKRISNAAAGVPREEEEDDFGAPAKNTRKM